MTRNQKLIVTAVFVCFIAATAMGQGQDVKGSKDHPLIKRYQGSWIIHYEFSEFDEKQIPLGPYTGGRFAKSQTVEGKVTLMAYQVPAHRSVLEVFRNYELALKAAGFQTLFTCAADACGGETPYGFEVPGFLGWWHFRGASRHLSAKLTRPEGDVYVSLHVQDPQNPATDGPIVSLVVVEPKPMETGLVTVDAAALASDISRTGHAAVYGIYFDTGKADVKPESDAALAEIAKLLEQDPKLKLHVVGHTDNVGTLASNMDLSKRRADAVLKVLTTKYKIAVDHELCLRERNPILLELVSHKREPAAEPHEVANLELHRGGGHFDHGRERQGHKHFVYRPLFLAASIRHRPGECHH